MDVGNFASGFLGAFGQAKAIKQEKEQNEREKKARLQLFELQLEREKASQAQQAQQQTAMQDVFSRLQGGAPLQSNPSVTLGDPRPQMSLAEMLADAGMQGTLVKAGLASPSEIVKANAQPELPNKIQELLYLRDHPELAALDQTQRASGAPSVSVNTGGPELPKPPAGFYRPDPTKPGLGPEPGGPAAREFAEADAKRLQRVQSVIAEADRVFGAVGDAEKLVSLGTAGFVGKRWSKVEGTDAFTLAQIIEMLQGNLAFGALQKMRDQSPTGGALGQVAIQEIELLKRTITSLDIGLKPSQLKKNLQAVQTHYQNLKEALTGGKAGLPEGIPSGSTQIGTSGGKPVYQSPDGKTWIVD